MNGLPHFQYDVVGLPAPGAERKPLLLFLHGRGECGTDLALMRRHGPPRLFPAHGLDRFVVIAPQCSAPPWDEERLEKFARQAVDLAGVDGSRVFLTGISMGGVGAWELATRCPGLFSAIAPICGGGEPARAPSLVDPAVKPVWLAHSRDDQVMAVNGSDALFERLRQLDGDVTYSRYRGLDHVATWERVYGSSMLYDWFLRQ